MKRRDFIKTAAGIWVPNIWIQRAEAQFQPGRSRSFRQQAAASSYLVSEDFEGTGTPSGWAATDGSPNYDYTPALNGSESLFLDGTGTSTGATSPTFTGQTTCYMYFMFQYSDNSLANSGGLGLRAGGTQVCYISFRSIAGLLRLWNGTSNTAVTGWVSGTTYHIWLDYVAGSGADGVSTLYRSTTSTKPAATATVTAGTSTGSVTNVAFTITSAANIDVVVDKVRVSASEIGSSPT